MARSAPNTVHVSVWYQLRQSFNVCVCFCSVLRSGTTLNLLKFPIVNPTPYRLFRRQERLNEASRQTDGEMSEDELKRLRRHGYLVGTRG